MSKKGQDTLGIILAVIGIALILVVDSPSTIILILVKLLGLACAVSGAVLMEVQKHE
ncbi:hypothetical protein [Lactobacillus phage PMBT4]|nr:hypothetical protein [Lactobacillus phage PMBT4]